jgi:GTP cyclohydrolase I
MEIKYSELIKDSVGLAKKIEKGKYSFVYGVPSGGILPAYIISKELGCDIISKIEGYLGKENILIVDDLIDSGRTLEKFKEYDTAFLYRKPHSPKTTYACKEISSEWINLPHEKSGNGMEDHVIRILEYIGENPNRDGLIDTPKRVVKMWGELFRGYDKEQKPKIAVFENGKDGLMYDQMIFDTGRFHSQCEHHMVPFMGEYYFAYIPDKKIIGLSKIARLVDYYSAKLQIQERLVKEVVDEVEKLLEPRGIALVMKAEHLCKSIRGVKKAGKMITTELRGAFKENLATRDEFLKLISIA